MMPGRDSARHNAAPADLEGCLQGLTTHLTRMRVGPTLFEEAFVQRRIPVGLYLPRPLSEVAWESAEGEKGWLLRTRDGKTLAQLEAPGPCGAWTYKVLAGDA
ncbi:MAG TPA: hypothetical protein VNZ52_11035 [Candidatus Thermoplasmatota archaeon]|nr:hypothetical protein [Candidatus Thermoplasmatota archaeon]